MVDFTYLELYLLGLFLVVFFKVYYAMTLLSHYDFLEFIKTRTPTNTGSTFTLLYMLVLYPVSIPFTFVTRTVSAYRNMEKFHSLHN